MLLVRMSSRIGGRFADVPYGLSITYTQLPPGFLDHPPPTSLRSFLVLTVWCLAGNTPVGDAKTDVAIFVDTAGRQLVGSFSDRKP